MTRIAILGTGRMGAAITRRFLATGAAVTLWNRTATKTAPLAALGADVAPDPASAVTTADIVITMLSDAEAVTATLWQAAAGLSHRPLIADMSTIGPEAARTLASVLPDGARLVDAPVVGSVPAVESGTLTILAGGDGPTVEAATVALQPLGTVRHCGELGSGAAVKLVVNTAMIGTVTVLGETLALSDRLGVDPGITEGVLAAGPLQVALARRDAVGAAFGIDMAAKDLRLALRAATLPVAAAVAEHLDHAGADGLGDADLAQLVYHIRNRRTP